MSTITVRLGHVLSGSRNLERLLTCCDQYIDKIYDHREVLALPPRAAEWRTRNEWILKQSNVQNGLELDDICQICDHDNGDWGTDRYCHYHLVDRCPSECLDAADGKRIAKLRLRQSLGMGMEVALLYRWKHMDRAMGFMLRGRAEHDILRHGLQLMYTSREVEEAEALVQQAANPDELPWQTKKAMKAGSVIRAFRNDVRAELLNKAFIMQQPIQVYLNGVLAADKANVALTEAMAVEPDSETTRELFVKSVTINRKFISGDAGREALSALSEMLQNTQCDRWTFWNTI